MAEPRPYPGAPRWVKVFGIVVLLAVLLFVILLLTRGPHGPQRHTRRGVSIVTVQSPAVSTPTPHHGAVTCMKTRHAVPLITAQRS